MFVLCVAVCIAFLTAAWFIITAPPEIDIEIAYKLAKPTPNGMVDWQGSTPIEAKYGKELMHTIQTSWADLLQVMPGASALVTHCDTRLPALAMTEAKLGLVWSNLPEKARFANALLLLSWVEFNKDLHERLQESDNCKETCDVYTAEMYEMIHDEPLETEPTLTSLQSLHRHRRDMINSTRLL